MSGCHVPLTMGNVAYSPGYGGYCGCPCHNGLIPWNSYQCFCHCNKSHPSINLLTKIVYLDKLENKKMEERIKILEESYQGLAAELRYLLDKATNKENKKPHKCPVCEGLGGTKISGVIDEACHPCTGRGIVWG